MVNCLTGLRPSGVTDKISTWLTLAKIRLRSLGPVKLPVINALVNSIDTLGLAFINFYRLVYKMFTTVYKHTKVYKFLEHFTKLLQ